MTENIRSRWFGRAWVDLLESDLSTSAKLIYVVMTSFGSESRAGLNAICKRASCKKPTVRKAQKELIEAGWLKLAIEGKGGKASSPRVWIVRDEIQPQAVVGQGIKKQHPAPPVGVENVNPHGVENVNPNREFNRESQYISFKEALDWFCDVWSKRHAETKYRPTPGECAMLKKFLTTNPIQPSDWFKGMAFYFECTDTFIVNKNHSMQFYISQFNSWGEHGRTTGTNRQIEKGRNSGGKKIARHIGTPARVRSGTTGIDSTDPLDAQR